MRNSLDCIRRAYGQDIDDGLIAEVEARPYRALERLMRHYEPWDIPAAPESGLRPLLDAYDVGSEFSGWSVFERRVAPWLLICDSVAYQDPLAALISEGEQYSEMFRSHGASIPVDFASSIQFWSSMLGLDPVSPDLIVQMLQSVRKVAPLIDSGLVIPVHPRLPIGILTEQETQRWSALNERLQARLVLDGRYPGAFDLLMRSPAEWDAVPTLPTFGPARKAVSSDFVVASQLLPRLIRPDLSAVLDIRNSAAWSTWRRDVLAIAAGVPIPGSEIEAAHGARQLELALRERTQELKDAVKGARALRTYFGGGATLTLGVIGAVASVPITSPGGAVAGIAASVAAGSAQSAAAGLSRYIRGRRYRDLLGLHRVVLSMIEAPA